jgi:hypothetical protein
LSEETYQNDRYTWNRTTQEAKHIEAGHSEAVMFMQVNKFRGEVSFLQGVILQRSRGFTSVKEPQLTSHA